MNQRWNSIFKQINFYRCGNNLILNEILERSFERSLSLSEKFEYTRALIALGAIEVNRGAKSFRWSSCEPLFEEGFTEDSKSSVQLLFEEREMNLNIEYNSKFSAFGEVVEEKLGPYSLVKNQTISTKKWSTFIGEENFEIFDFSSLQWSSIDTISAFPIALLRQNFDFHEKRFFVVDPDSDTAKEILAPDWAYIVASQSIKKDLPFSITNNSKLAIAPVIAIPPLLVRYLFSYCSSARFSYGYEFHLKHEAPLTFLKKWLNA